MFKSKKLGIRWGLTSISLLAIGLSGCQDFSAVGELGKRGELIQITSEKIGRDFYQSCENRAKLPDYSKIKTEKNKDESLFFPKVIETRTEEIQECQEKYFSASETIVELNSVLVLYLQKLAILADENTGEIAQTDKEQLQGAADNLFYVLNQKRLERGEELLSPIVANNVRQGIGILGIFLEVLVEKTKKDAIFPAMICTDDDIQKYTQGLESISNQVYINALNNEILELDNYHTQYTPSISSIKDNLLPHQAVALFSLNQQYNDKVDEIEARKNIGIEFANFLKETRIAHGKISEEFANSFDYGKARTKEQFCKNYEAKIATADTSFELNKIQARKIATILKDYQEKTEPLLKILDQ